MDLILTMAGQYSRFIDEGYRIPKYLSASWKYDTLDQLESIANLANNNQSTTLLVRMHPNMHSMPIKVRNDYYNLGLKYQNVHIIGPRNKISTYDSFSKRWKKYHH